MNAPTTIVDLFCGPLEKAQVAYMTTGSIASMVYGEPRFTHDIDLVLRIENGDLVHLQRCFPEDHFYFPPREVLEVELKRGIRSHFNIIHMTTGFKADIYVVGRDPLHHWAMENKRRIPFFERSIWVAPPEYVLIRKIQYYMEGRSEKHVKDIRAMLVLTSLDHDFVLSQLRPDEKELWLKLSEENGQN